MFTYLIEILFITYMDMDYKVSYLFQIIRMCFDEFITIKSLNLFERFIILFVLFSFDKKINNTYLLLEHKNIELKSIS